MIIHVCGKPFLFVNPEALLPIESEALRRIDSGDGPGEPFRIILSSIELEDRSAYEDDAPATINAEAGAVFMRHRRFVSVIRVDEAELYRPDSSDAAPLEMTMRTILSCRMPREGGLLVHGAGVVIDGEAVIFFGASGAGKSTIASLMPLVINDELVAVSDGFARSTGFWDTLSSVVSPRERFPLKALVELGRGPSVSFTRLPRHQAIPALLNVAVVPPLASLWSETLRVINGMIERFPVMRLNWTASEENAANVRATIAKGLDEVNQPSGC